jgi:carboxymethylenebutenolidase
VPVAGAVTDPDQVVDEDVTYERGGSPVSAYLARPKAAGSRPGVVVVHEATGVDEHIRDVARRFAAAGFTAIAPELYSRVGRPSADDRPAMFAKMFGLRDEDIVADLVAAASLLHEREDSDGRVGIIGFCMGGRSALLAACSSTAFDATVDCWGGFALRATPDADTTPERPQPVADLLDQLHGRVYVVAGAEDQNPSPEDVGELRRRLEAAGKDVVIEVYDDAGHAFFNDTREQFYREGPANRLWERVIAFLKMSST